MLKTKLMVPLCGLAVVGLATATAMAQGIADETAVARAEYVRAAHAVYEAAYPQDPADSLYRAARERLNRNAYRDAARMFREVYARYPRSSYTAQSLYYEAFSLYRLGQTSDLRAARDALRTLQRDYAEAEVAYAEAEQLMARVQAQLAERGDEAAARELTLRARELEEARGIGQGERCSEEDEIRMAALNGLLNMDPEQAKPMLRRVVERTDGCAEMRMQALMVLSQQATEEDLPTFLKVAREDPNPDVRAQAVMWMMGIPGDAALNALQEILETSDDPDMQNAALMGLAQSRNPEAKQALRNYALRDDAPVELRAQAIMWVGHDGSPESKRFLRDVYESSEDPEVKEGIFMTLATQYGHEDEETARWMLSVALDEDESPEVRHQAMFWAAQSGLPPSELVTLYESVDDPELKQAIVFSLIQNQDEGVVDALLKIARQETDPELRANLVFWLSQKDDPRVKAFLIEIIEGGGS
jgi:HEAT repeat protein